MFIGHALLAFALVAGAAAVLDFDRPLMVGGVAGAFAAVPDADMAYALVGLVGTGTAQPEGMLELASAFWSAGNVVHRSVTHSIVLAPVVAAAVGMWVVARRSLLGGVRHTASLAVTIFVVATLIVIATVVSGLLAGAVTLAFVTAALVVAELVARRTPLRPVTVSWLALVGLTTHPFGDLFTGEPPRLLYPLNIRVFFERVTLHPDSTLHLLGAFGLELAAIWAGVLVWLRLTGRPLRPRLDPRGMAGVGYASLVVLIPAPTLEVSYPFVFTVLAVGLIGFMPWIRRANDTGPAVPEIERGVVTGLLAVTVAVVAYAIAYSVVFAL